MRNKIVTKEMAMEMAADTPLLKRNSMEMPQRGKGKLVQVFTNVNMGKGHDGLTAICAQYDLDIASLEAGQYVVFTNRAMNKVKLFGSNNVIAYLKLPPGSHVSLAALALIPLAFQGSPDIEYDPSLGQFFGVQEILGNARRRILVRPDVDIER